MRLAAQLSFGFVLLVVSAAGCGSAPQAITPVTSGEATTPASPATASSTSTIASPTKASCDPKDLVGVVDKLVTDGTNKHVVVSVTVGACRNGFVQLLATGDQSGCAPDGTVGHVCSEPQPMWLKDVGGVWTLVGSGTGIGCEPPGGIIVMEPEITEACRALWPPPGPATT